jgi:hypothetical protein
MTEFEKTCRTNLISLYDQESTATIRIKLYYYLGSYRKNRPDWTVADWIDGLSTVLFHRRKLQQPRRMKTI